MTTPTYCTSCGHELGIGRFCTNCGKPVPGRHPEAPLAAPVVPPPASATPPAARYPLYAEDPPEGPGRSIAPDAPTAVAPALPPPPAPSYDASGRRRMPGWLPWVLGVVLLVLVALVVGAVVTTSGGKAEEPHTVGTPGSESAQPDTKGTEAPVERPGSDAIVDLSRDATAEVPAVAPPSRDRSGEPVTFAAANMLDGRVRTSWRMAGDGTGATITFDLGHEVVLTEVAIINGYAKIDGPDNWYRGNRRLRSVQWEFDDGSRITQDLQDRRSLQTLGVGPLRTSTVRLHLVQVSPPGTGRSGRDFTAVSEVRLRGAPADERD
ncbi:MAG TPA: zinc ribbon domain-containing protein [Nocardioides sp.]|nr:zinc ribbon domain-containing protein [Nocardioides sp.]